MKIYPIETGNFKLDGGAMFGVVPKSLWEKTNPADKNNQIELAMRCLLIEVDSKLILIDTGIGNKQSDKFFSYFNLFGNNSLKKSLNKIGFDEGDITDVFLTHLHFDHVGGAVEYDSANTGLKTTFPNAKYWIGKDQWEWAINPNNREKNSFLKENIIPIRDSKQLELIDFDEKTIIHHKELGFDILRVNGHTDGQMIPIIKYKGKTIVYMADFIPTTGHIPITYIMGYDTRPLITLNEKEDFLKEAANENYILFLEHDAYYSACTVKNTEKGVRLDSKLQFEDIFN